MHDETERAIDETLEGRPRAEELAEMIAALDVRRATFLRERDAALPEQREVWASRVREVEQQIAVLREEEAITEFVENSVRFTVHRPRPEDIE